MDECQDNKELMYIAVDPSLRNTAWVTGRFCGGKKGIPQNYYIVHTKKDKSSKVSEDRVFRVSKIFKEIKAFFNNNKDKEWVQISETPTGSRNYSAALSVGISTAIIAYISTFCSYTYTVTPQSVKKMLKKNNSATKGDIISFVDKTYPNFLPKKSDGTIHKGKAEHIADAVLIGKVIIDGKEAD